jgi:ribosomal protein L40E
MKGNSRPARLECPGCGGFSFSAGPDGRLVCDYCQAVCALAGPVCPECGAAYEPGARYCPTCGADLVRECRACGAQNPPSARRCTACGQDLNVLDALFARATGETAHWLRQTREEATAVKAQQEAASQARLAEMWAAEQRRREELAQAQAERDRQMRILWGVAAVLFFIVAVIIIVAAVLNNLSPAPFSCDGWTSGFSQSPGSSEASAALTALNLSLYSCYP